MSDHRSRPSSARSVAAHAVRVGIVAWAVMAGAVLSLFAQQVVPSNYLARPLGVAGLIALPLVAIALIFGRYAVLVGALLAALVTDPGAGALGALLALTAVLYLRARRRPDDLTTPVIVLVAVFFVLGLGRSAPLMIEDIRLDPVAAFATSGGPPLYVIMLDGYPRADSLAERGIHNDAFIHELERRGFDHYPSATTPVGWTELALTMMLSDADVEDIPTDVPEKRRLRKLWQLPNGFLAIDPPLGFITIPHAPRVSAVAVTDFEAHLLGNSLFGQLFSDGLREALGASVRHQHEYALEVVRTTDAYRVFAHILAPHPPFVFSADEGSNCWPEDCHLWRTTSANLFMSEQGWISAMGRQISGLNDRLLTTIDSIINRRPDAVIVLLSDHGMRESREDQGEWHRSFLAARTPEHPELFAEAPHPGAVMHLLVSTYDQ